MRAGMLKVFLFLTFGLVVNRIITDIFDVSLFWFLSEHIFV